MSDDKLRVDRAAYQTHADDTHANLANFRGAADNVDRQQGFLQQMTEDGAGSEELGNVRAGTRHATDEVHTNSTKLANRTSETADEFITNVSNAASKNLRSIN
ncbi:MAG TPA: hypothetical protein VFO98_07515 [Marmoricola sp.]|jgi:hypothetical protein|nr:hypothetical protein [Marmoricola sp.]